ncbi:hypothetical protein KY284_020362 [Solanum tuberosum]|nr:hypothetical protein KY284_020362 [Solanum tuberosum]
MVMKTRFKMVCDSTSWLQIVEALEGYSPNYSFRIVRWLSPPINWLKCNTDGASRGNPRPSSTAFCIRNHLGNLIVAKGFKIQDSTNLVAEARAIREGLVFCKDNMIKHVIIESDSMAMVQILEGRWDTPWSVALEVNMINGLRRGDFQFNQYHDIPSEAKTILNMDKISTPYIRSSIPNS